MMQAESKKYRVLFCYSPADEELLKELECHLTLLKYRGVIEVWHLGLALAGDPSDAALLSYLEEAEIIILLISSDFIASASCYEQQMGRAMERHRSDEARVIPVILRPGDYAHASFESLVSFPNGPAVTKWGNRDEAWQNVTRGLREVIDPFISRSAESGAQGLLGKEPFSNAVPPSPCAQELDAIVRRIRAEPVLISLFKRFWDDAPLARFFSSHREDLFVSIGPEEGIGFHVRIPYLFWWTSTDNLIPENSVLSAFLEMKDAARDSVVGIPDQRMEELMMGFKRAAIYFMVKFVDKNRHLARLINERQITLSAVDNVLSNGLTVEGVFDEALQELEKAFSFLSQDGVPGEGDMRFASSTEQDSPVRSWASKFALEMRTIMGDQISRHMSQGARAQDAAGLARFWIYALQQFLMKMQVRGIDKAKYQEILVYMYLKRILSHSVATAWCEKCEDDPFVTSTFARMSPNQISNWNCPKCNKRLSVVCLYDIIEPLRDVLLWRHGLLSIAVAMYFTEHRIEFEVSSDTDEECGLDFLFRIKDKKILLRICTERASRTPTVNTDRIVAVMRKGTNYGAELQVILTNNEVRTGSQGEKKNSGTEAGKKDGVILTDTACFKSLLKDL